MSLNGKSVLSGQERGFIRLVAREDNEKIVGAQLMCARATDMIGELALAISRGITAGELAGVIHPHPTLGRASVKRPGCCNRREHENQNNRRLCGRL